MQSYRALLHVSDKTFLWKLADHDALRLFAYLRLINIHLTYLLTYLLTPTMPVKFNYTQRRSTSLKDSISILLIYHRGNVICINYNGADYLLFKCVCVSTENS